MKKVFRGPDRVQKEMEWEAKHKDKIVVTQLEGHDGRLTVYYIGKDEEVIDDA